MVMFHITTHANNPNGTRKIPEIYFAISIDQHKQINKQKLNEQPEKRINKNFNYSSEYGLSELVLK